MSKIVLGVAVGILAFILGLAGAYMAMPKFNPELVAETDRVLDSLALADSAAIQAQHDSLLQAPPPYVDPETILRPALSELQEAMVTTLTDSLAALRKQVEDADTDVQTLQQHVQALQRRLDEQDRRRKEASQLSGTLSKLEDKELTAVLAQLDQTVLEQLYIEASERNRKRLLQTMPPERAALMVRGLVAPPAPNADAALSPDGSAADLS